MELKNRKCEPCGDDAEAIPQSQYDDYLKELPGWEVRERDGVPRLEKTFEFTNYVQCLAFVHSVGKFAEEKDHHPEMTVTWGKVQVAWWTHTLEGLHINDFIMAANCDELAETFYV